METNERSAAIPAAEGYAGQATVEYTTGVPHAETAVAGTAALHSLASSHSTWSFEPPRASRRKTFLICGAIALLILVSYNLVIHYVAASSQRRQLLSDLQHIPPTTDCLFVGNSLVEAGCAPRV